MAYGEIRTVHAILPDGTMIVRYDRAKRWFHEDSQGRRIKRFRRVSDAARLVHSQAGTAFIGRPEGRYFDKYMQGEWDGTPVPPVQRYTEAGLRQAIKRAQAKYNREVSRWETSGYTHINPTMVSYYQQYDWGREYLRSVRKPKPKPPPILKRKAS